MFPESSTPPCQTRKPLIPRSAIPATPIRHTVLYAALIPRESPRRTPFASANVLQCRDKNLFSFLHLFTPAYPAPPLSHSAGAPMSPEDGAPKPITPHRTAFVTVLQLPENMPSLFCQPFYAGSPPRSHSNPSRKYVSFLSPQPTFKKLTYLRPTLHTRTNPFGQPFIIVTGNQSHHCNNSTIQFPPSQALPAGSLNCLRLRHPPN